MADAPNVTERQAKYFATLRASLEPTTGKNLAQWVEIARSCPETKHRARLKWLKENHGLLQNRASYVLDGAFGSATPWREADTLLGALWTDADAHEIYLAIDTAAASLPGALRTARRGYTAWSRTFQFAAARPLKSGGVVLGLATTPDADPGLEPPRSESWSERLKSRLTLASPDSVDERVRSLLRSAWEDA
jgi:hypothetical protein